MRVAAEGVAHAGVRPGGGAMRGVKNGPKKEGTVTVGGVDLAVQP